MTMIESMSRTTRVAGDRRANELVGRLSPCCCGQHDIAGSCSPIANVYTFHSVSIYEETVARKYPAAAKGGKRVEEPKVAMSYRLSREKIARAQRVLGTPTATATIEEALDLVVFGRELADGLDHAFGIPIRDVFPASRRRKGR